MLGRVPAPEPSPSTWQSLRAVMGSWRLASVSLLSFSSGLPLGLVWIAIPTWMKQEGVDIRVVGLFTLVQAPWTFKFLWSPLVDRYAPPLLGRKRGWMLLSQLALLVLGLWLAGVSRHPDAVWVIGALALATAVASATQDIAYDGYAVEVLQPEEHGLAVSARLAFYRAAMLVAGGWAITHAAETSWRNVNLLLALLYVPAMLVTVLAPEPEVRQPPPKTLRQAVWEPFVGFLGQHRALEILAFVVLFKLSDNLTQALIRPFLVEVGFGAFDVGLATATIGMAAMLLGALIGGAMTQRLGLGRALWISGFLQIFSNLGYAAVAEVGVNRPVMYAAQAFELGTSGVGTGAFGVLLLRLTEKRFSATQYALLSSLFSLPRVLAGPPAGLLADALGWRDFYVLTVFLGIPGLILLQRFVPWSLREPVFHVAEPSRGRPVTAAAVAGWSALAGALVLVAGWVAAAGLAAVKGYREDGAFRLRAEALRVLSPDGAGEWMGLAGVGLGALLAAVAIAATLVARRGLSSRPGGTTLDVG
jgi:MFS transporter, PAT family, beta-lactamase induction signal transducer AmpG